MILLAAITDIMFSSPLALLALASVIPLIILYLLRPRTIDLDIPSLLFFLKREQQRNKLSLLLRKLIRDPLFIIQLLVLILLSLAAAAPYIMEEKVSGQHTVIVIDNSASMQAGGRLDEAKALASERLSAVNSVVWAQNVPVLAVKEGDKTRTKEVIALEDGYRESTDSWLSLLRDLKRRGMPAPKLATGDGALGFWAALRQVYSGTKEQRCWVHKNANVLDKLPKRVQPRAKDMLHEIMYALRGQVSQSSGVPAQGPR